MSANASTFRDIDVNPKNVSNFDYSPELQKCLKTKELEKVNYGVYPNGIGFKSKLKGKQGITFSLDNGDKKFLEFSKIQEGRTYKMTLGDLDYYVTKSISGAFTVSGKVEKGVRLTPFNPVSVEFDREQKKSLSHESNIAFKKVLSSYKNKEGYKFNGGKLLRCGLVTRKVGLKDVRNTIVKISKERRNISNRETASVISEINSRRGGMGSNETGGGGGGDER